MTLQRALRTKKLLLFDFDGVLADSEPVHRLAYNTVLAAWGHHVPENDYWKYWTSLGEGVEGEIRRRGLTGIDPDAVKRAKRRLFEQYCAAGRVPLFPETPGLLSALIRSTRWDFAIASNTPAPLVEQILRLGGSPVPERIFGGEALPPKPAPDIFLAAVAGMGHPPEATIVVEDAEKGVLAARRAGLHCVLVVTALNSGLDVEADFRIQGLSVLQDLLFPASPA